MPVLQLLLFALLANTAYLTSALVAARFLGARAEAARLGAGPRLVTLSLGGTRLEVCPLPIVAWVQLEGMAETEGPRVGFRALHPLRRVGVMLGSWVLPLLLSALLLGPPRAGHHLVTMFPQAVQGLRTEVGTGLCKAFLALPFQAALGVFLAKITAVNLLPLPSLAGGQALRYLLAWIAPSTDRDHKALVALHLLAILLLLGFSLQWLHCFYLALRA